MTSIPVHRIDDEKKVNHRRYFNSWISSIRFCFRLEQFQLFTNIETILQIIDRQNQEFPVRITKFVRRKSNRFHHWLIFSFIFSITTYSIDSIFIDFTINNDFSKTKIILTSFETRCVTQLSALRTSRIDSLFVNCSSTTKGRVNKSKWGLAEISASRISELSYTLFSIKHNSE